MVLLPDTKKAFKAMIARAAGESKKAKLVAAFMPHLRHFVAVLQARIGQDASFDPRAWWEIEELADLHGDSVHTRQTHFPLLFCWHSFHSRALLTLLLHTRIPVAYYKYPSTPCIPANIMFINLQFS
jgi:hypothetical protein